MGNHLEELRPFFKLYSFPQDILIETISKCNLNCIMCPQSKMTRKTGKMTLDIWEKIINEIAEKSPETRIWPAFMGEPLLVKELFQMIKYAKERGVKYVGLNTNLNAFSEDMIDGLLTCGINEMFIGIDGASKETYEKIRVNGCYEKTINNINFIIKEKERRNLKLPAITLQFIAMDENEKEEKGFIDFWKNKKMNIKLKIRKRIGWSYGVDPWKKMAVLSKEKRNIPCTWLLSQMGIFWDGRVPQCDADWDGRNICGDIRTQSISEIWGGKILALRKKHLELDFNYEPCCNCDDWQAGRSVFIDCNETA